MDRCFFPLRSATLLLAATLLGLLLGCHGVGPESDGTRELDRVEKYDPATDTWTEVPPTPDKMAWPACAECSGRLYAFYGYSAFDYYPSSNTWTKKEDIPIHAKGMNAFTVGGKIYLLGTGDNDTPYVDAVLEYDPNLDTWSSRNPIPRPRTGQALSECNGKIYVFGGEEWSQSTEPGAPDCFYYEYALEYDPATDTWADRPPLPSKRGGMEAATVGGTIYLLGGMCIPDGATSGDFVTDIYAYDTATGVTTVIPSNFNEYYRVSGYSAAIAKDGKIFVTGGLLAEGAWDAVFEYDPAGNAWVKKAGMPTSRYNHTLGILGGEIYAVCGVGAPAH